MSHLTLLLVVASVAVIAWLLLGWSHWHPPRLRRAREDFIATAVRTGIMTQHQAEEWANLVYTIVTGRQW